MSEQGTATEPTSSYNGTPQAGHFSSMFAGVERLAVLSGADGGCGLGGPLPMNRNADQFQTVPISFPYWQVTYRGLRAADRSPECARVQGPLNRASGARS
jgi:hypothetical protein